MGTFRKPDYDEWIPCGDKDIIKQAIVSLFFVLVALGTPFLATMM